MTDRTIKKGSLRELSPGRWEMVLSLGKDPATEKYLRLSRTFHGTEAQAVRALERLRREQFATGTASAMTVADLLDRHLADLHVEGKSPSTLIEYERLVRTVLKPALGSKPSAALTVADLDGFYRAELDRGQSASSVRQTHAILSGALSRAGRKGWLGDQPANVARYATVPAKPARKVEAPSAETVRALLEAARATEPADRALLLRLAAVTGLRRGELCGLRWADLADGALLIQRNVVVARSTDPGAIRPSSGRHRTAKAARRYIQVKPLKVENPRRIALDADTLVELLRHQALMEARAEQCDMTLAPAAYLFSDDADQARPWYPGIVTETVQRIRRVAGITDARILHGLRHYAATEMLANGIDPEVGATRLGHSSTKTFLDTYTSARPARDQAAADHLGSLLRD